MAKINRYGGNLQAFGSEAQGTERTIFGDTTQDDTLDANITTEFLRGWGIVGVNENPTKQDFNALGYTVSQLVAYLHQAGVPEWHVEQEYFEGAVTITQVGVYRSLVDGNIGNDPDTDDGSNWEGIPTPEQVNTQVNERGFAQAVDSVSDLRAGSYLTSLERVWLSGYYGVGTAGGGPLYRDSGDTTTADNGGTVFVDADGVRWKRSVNGPINVDWFGAEQGDIGSVLNTILSEFDPNIDIYIPPRTYTCSTTIDLDTASVDSSIRIVGSGISAGTSPSNGTIIDGSAMTADVLNGARTQNNFHLILRDFTILSGSAGGMIIGDRSAGHNASHSAVESIVVEGGAPGIALESFTNGWVNHIYSVNADGTGVYLNSMNACKFGIVTVRQAQGSWAMDIEKGLGSNYGTLYLESNNKSALRIADDQRGCRIDHIYTENNNVDGTQDYEILIGDSNVSSENVEGFKIGSWFLSAAANAYNVAQIGADLAFYVTLGPLWATEDPLFATVGSSLKNIVFQSWSLAGARAMDFTSGADESYYTFLNCNINPLNISFPDTAPDINIDIIGCNRLLQRLKMVAVSGNHVMRAWEEWVTVDTNGGPVTITPPDTVVASGKAYTIQNTGGSGNNVTVDPSGSTTIQGSSTHTLSDGAARTYVWDHVNSDWRIMSGVGS